MRSGRSPTKHRSSPHSNGFNSLLRTALIALALLTILIAGVQSGVRAEPYVDQRVTKISASTLLASPPMLLVDPRRQQAAQGLDARRRASFFFWLFSQIAALAAFWRSGYAARLRDVLTARIRNALLMRFVFGAAIATIAALAALPANLIAYRNAVGFDVSGESVVSWVRDITVSWFLAALVVGLLSAFIYTLVARTRQWYLYAAAGVFAFALTAEFLHPVIVAPMFDRYFPLPPATRGALAIDTLERRAGLAAEAIFVDVRSHRSRVVASSVRGLGPTERVLLSDTLLANATPGEIGFVTAREFAHVIYGDPLRMAIAQTVAIILTVALGMFIADRVGFRRDDDALARLPLVGAMLGLAVLVMLPAYNAYARGVEDRADRYALTLTNDRVGAVRFYVRLADEALMPVCVGRPERLFFMTHEPIATRVATVLERPDPCS